MHLLRLLLEDYLQMLFPEQFSILDQCNWIKIVLFIHSFILVKLDYIVFLTSNYYSSFPLSPEHKDVDHATKQTAQHLSLQTGMCFPLFRDPCWVDQSRMSG